MRTSMARPVLGRQKSSRNSPRCTAGTARRPHRPAQGRWGRCLHKRRNCGEISGGRALGAIARIAAVGLALALGAGCARSQYWARDDFDGTKVKLPWYTPGANSRVTVGLSEGAMHLTDAGTQPGDLLFPTRQWGADPAEGAAVEARVKVVDCVGAAGVMLMVADGVHEDSLTLYKDRIRLEKAEIEHVMDTTDAFHVYRLDIRDTDIAVSVDGKRVIDGRDRFTKPAHDGRNCVGYGAGSSAATGEAYWDWLTWTAPAPSTLKVPTVPGAEQVIVYKKEGVYACFPALLMDPDTECLYSSFGTKVKQSHIDPTGGSTRTESRDGGRTWQEVKTIPPTARGGRPGSVFTAPDGALIEIGQYFWRRYPAEQKPELQKKYYIQDNCGPGPGKVATCTGGFVRRSTDGGKTWERQEIPELDTHKAASSAWSCCQLPDGTVLRAFMVQKTAGDTCDSYVVRTKDGKTYDVVRAMWDPDRKAEVTEENVLHVMNDGNVWMMARIGVLSNDDFMWQSFSDDGGATWRTVKTAIKGHPPSGLIRLQDGRLLLTYGYRHVPFGIRAVLSDDDGRTWRTDRVQVLRTDGDNFDLGYAYSVQLKDGTIVTVYYFVTADFITHIACTRWQPPKW